MGWGWCSIGRERLLFRDRKKKRRKPVIKLCLAVQVCNHGNTRNWGRRAKFKASLGKFKRAKNTTLSWQGPEISFQQGKIDCLYYYHFSCQVIWSSVSSLKTQGWQNHTKLLQGLKGKPKLLVSRLLPCKDLTHAHARARMHARTHACFSLPCLLSCLALDTSSFCALNQSGQSSPSL